MMTHQDFLVWMLGFPLVMAGAEVLRYKFSDLSKWKMNTPAKVMIGLYEAAVWLGVGLALWRATV